ncbi:hypothetical protein B0T19DRAFT_456820 [Cercophora scortea]|uniref:Uncharacterized protein n=1 Tax=Cercophora scortea TaxID=314031 RepID=A0AAE0MGY7_9PEZI|nr:hypothetical protein B0T19DRAFT_456820 [Cercophora scortea]
MASRAPTAEPSSPTSPIQTPSTPAEWNQVPLGPPPPPGLFPQEAPRSEPTAQQDQTENRYLEGFSVSKLEVGATNLKVGQVGPESDSRFSYLAVCANAALETLELRDGRAALRKLGCLAVKRWERVRHEATGSPLLRYVRDVEDMGTQVDLFLRTIRRDFPHVVLADTGSVDTLACFHKRHTPEAMLRPGDQAPRLHHDWKAAGFLAVNRSRVQDMARTHTHLLRTQQAGLRQPDENLEVQRFVFAFACEIIRELGHLFVSMLSQGLREVHPSRRLVEGPADFDAISFKRGACGRGLQMLLFGGTIDVLRDSETRDNEAGIPVIRDESGAASRVADIGIRELVEARESFQGNLLTEDIPIPVSDFELGVYRSMAGDIVPKSIRKTAGWRPEPDVIFDCLMANLNDFAQSRVVVSTLHGRARDVDNRVGIIMPS